MPPKKAATPAAKKTAPAKKAPVAKKAAAKKAPAKKATKTAGQKRARSPTPSDAETDSSDEKAPPAKRSKRQAESTSESSSEDEEDAPIPQAKAKKATPDKHIVDLFGKFDNYAKDLPCLDSGYDNSSPNFEKLLGLMKGFQAEADFTARAAIPKSYGTSDGAFQIKNFEDPMSGEEYEICLEGIQLTGKTEPTVKAELSFDGGCGLSSSSGTLSLHRCWNKSNSDEGFDEMFDCTFSVNVSYSDLYRRKGHGSGERISMECWAIRARKNSSGEEV